MTSDRKVYDRSFLSKPLQRDRLGMGFNLKMIIIFFELKRAKFTFCEGLLLN